MLASDRSAPRRDRQPYFMKAMTTFNTAETLIFVHIPKAGGTTLNFILSRFYPEDVTFRIDGSRAAESIAELQQLPEEKKDRIRCLKGHMPFGLHEYLPGPARYITVLRHPVERVISHYYFVRRFKDHYMYDEVTSADMSLADYVQSGISSELSNGQVRLLSGSISGCTRGDEPCTKQDLGVARDNLENRMTAGLAEEFDASLLLFRDLLGWDKPYYISRNVTRGRTRTPDIPKTTLEIIETANTLDMELYETAKSQFSLKLKARRINRKVFVFQQLNKILSKKLS